MTWLKSIWRKMFKKEEVQYIMLRKEVSLEDIKKLYPSTYDPSTDEHKIMSGEVESYFE